MQFNNNDYYLNIHYYHIIVKTKYLSYMHGHTYRNMVLHWWTLLRPGWCIALVGHPRTQRDSYGNSSLGFIEDVRQL